MPPQLHPPAIIEQEGALQMSPQQQQSHQSDDMMMDVTTGNMGNTCSDTVCAVSLTMQQSSLEEDQQMLDDLRDVVQALKAQEALYSSTASPEFPLFFDSWRPVMVSWMYSVIDTFALNELCVPTGIYFLDTCSHLLDQSAAQTKAKELYPLMALTSLNLAVKCHETRMFPLDQLVQLMGGKNNRSNTCVSNHAAMRYTPDDVIRMEQTLLQGCRWKLHPATSIDFLHQFVLVLEEGTTRINVMQRAMIHLKNASLWEHVLQQQRRLQTPQPDQPRSFSPSTLAYASLLLAMEDLQIPLADKQACCLALLHIADLSTHTPFLSQAYNWLVYAHKLQQQLVRANQKPVQATRVPTAEPPAVVSPTRVPTPKQQAFTKADFDPPSAHCQKQAESQPAIVSPAPSTATTKTMDTCTTVSNSLTMQESTDSMEESRPQQEEESLFESDDESEEYPEDDRDDDLSDSEVIFYSHTYMGDGFEVMTLDMEEAGVGMGSCQVKAMDAFSLTSPLGPEGLPPGLILTESLDEDGFEVSYALVRGSVKAVEQLSSMLASPRDVVA